MDKRRKKQKENTIELSEKKKLIEGDIVLRKNKDKKHKFDVKWTGPFVIKYNQGSGSYLISDIESKYNAVEHRKNLKRVSKNGKLEKMLCDHKKILEDKEQFRSEGIVTENSVSDAFNRKRANDDDFERVKRIKLNCACFNSKDFSGKF
ncbi:hypothetical protein COBT_004228 [Conglomerata obtusa]